MSDMSYLQEKPVAVLGAGAVGKAQAADCALAGARVRFCDLPPFSSKTLFGVRESGLNFYGPQLNLYSFERSGIARMELVTEDIAAAIKGAGLVVVATPAFGHQVFFKKLIPCLEDGMVIHIFPDNFGSLLLRKMMAEAGCTKKVIIGGWSSSPYGSRVDIKGGVVLPRIRVYYRAITLRGAAMPMADQDNFLESAKYLGSMDCITQNNGLDSGDTALDIGFSNVNPVLHCPGTILGVGVMENWGVIYGNDKYDYSIYSHAYCPSIAKVQYSFYLEQCAIAEKIGVGIQSFKKEQFFHRESILGAEYMGPDYVIPFTEQDYIQYGTGPFDINNRYITEDIPVGCHIYHELGQVFGINTPVIDSMINLASVMMETDYYQNGYTLDYIGLGGKNKDELNRYLREAVI